MADNSPPATSSAASPHSDVLVTMGFGNSLSFDFTFRTARMFSQSTMVPAAYQGCVLKGYGEQAQWEENPAAISNCMIALDMAQRMGANPLQVMQNLHVIEGRPSWSSSFIIAVINTCGHYSKLRFDLEWFDDVEVPYTVYEWVAPPGGGKKVKTPYTKTQVVKNARCVAWAIEKESGDRLESAPVTLVMAVQEGWYTKAGSKWPTMPETMLRYRAASFFGKIYAPELLMGLPSAEETHDVIDVERQPDGTYAAPPASGAPASSPAPRAPRAKPADAPAAPPAPEPALEVAAEPTPIAAPKQEAEPEPVAEVREPAPAAAEQKPGADVETGEVTQSGTLFDTAPAEPAAAAATAKPTTKAAAKAAAKPAPAEKEPSTPPLSKAKIEFVKGQLDKGGFTTADFTAKFSKTPEELREPEFPTVLAWFKDAPGK